MVRIIKVLATVMLALMAVGITFVVLFFMLPSWQKAVVDNTLAADGERQWQLGSIQLSPSGITAGDVFVLDQGVGLEIGHLEFNGPFWKAPLQGRLEVNSGRIEGLFLDVSTVQVGDLTSSDWQGFVERVSGDEAFWKERLGLVLQKVSSTGLEAHLTDITFEGQALLPGETLIPIRWHIIEADSRDPASVELEPLPEVSAPVL
jgi:hypothetical protein